MVDKPGRRKKKGPEKSRWERWVAVILIAIGISGIPLAFLFYSTPDAVPINQPQNLILGSWSINLNKTIYNSQTGTNTTTAYFPSIIALFNNTFVAQGNYGADNRIWVHVEITRANLSGWQHFYCQVAYTGAYFTNQTTRQALLPVKVLPDGNLGAEGWVQWQQPGPSYAWLMPCIAGERATYTIPAQAVIRNNPSAITIGPISDTDNWQNAQLQTRLLIMGAFWTPAIIFEVVKRTLGF